VGNNGIATTVLLGLAGFRVLAVYEHDGEIEQAVETTTREGWCPADSTLNRGGVRMGTSEFYRVVEAFPEVEDSLVIDTSGAGTFDGELLCFVVLTPGTTLAEIEPTLRQALRTQLSPRHVPDRFSLIAEVPRTLNGKKCEVPVKKILAGTPPAHAVSHDALRNAAALEPFIEAGASCDVQGRCCVTRR
jgi:acetoacetyl-CoA synthetase